MSGQDKADGNLENFVNIKLSDFVNQQWVMLISTDLPHCFLLLVTFSVVITFFLKTK